MQLCAHLHFAFAVLLSLSTVICKSSSGFGAEAEAKLLERETGRLDAEDPSTQGEQKPKCRRLGQSSGLRRLGNCNMGEAQEGVTAVNLDNLQQLPQVHPTESSSLLSPASTRETDVGYGAIDPSLLSSGEGAQAKQALVQKLQSYREKVRLCNIWI